MHWAIVCLSSVKEDEWQADDFSLAWVVNFICNENTGGLLREG